MRRQLTLLIAILCVFAAARGARANHLGLEGGLNSAGNFPNGTDVTEPFVSVGFSGQLSYEIRHWSFGARVLGTASYPASIDLVANGYEVRGHLGRREYRLELVARYFFPETPDNRGLYLELGFLGHETDFIRGESVVTLPESQDYTRLFVRGSGFTLGMGFRPRSGPWFYQLSYELDYYQTLEVTGLVNYLHPILVEAPLSANSFNHSVFFMIGLDVFGR